MRRLLPLLLLLLPACTLPEGNAVYAPDLPGLGSGPEVDVFGSEGVIHEDGVEALEFRFAPEEVWAEEIADPGCQPGDGCFLDPCEDGGDCLSGICVGHLGDSVCTKECIEECPDGWLCSQVGTGPDMLFACVSPYTHLCRPCADGGDCMSASGVEDVCVAYGDVGSFCGAPCQAGQCPSGYSCVDATTVAGAVLKQCVANAGVCSCSQASVALGLTTPCIAANEFGQCDGIRFCTEDGLSPCDAPVATLEKCNGLDDDCNGQVDDVSCDDGNACTEDTCDPGTGCQHAALNGTECVDGDVCTLADHCLEGVCIGTAINCDDGNICTTDACDPTGGCLYAFNGVVCDDGDACTVGDACSQGICAGFGINCDCWQDSDCLALEDGDLCNGKLVCDKQELPYECTVAAATVIECPAPAGLDAPCQQSACHPLTGECSFEPDHEGWGCEDGNPCTVGDKCVEGACSPGVPVNCNDGNPCTDDSCDDDQGCVHLVTSAPCNDNNVCTTGDKCMAGACNSTGTLSCDDGNPCTDDSCDVAVGCVHVFNNAACDDLNECTAVDVCVNGMCAGSGFANCDDNEPCTDDYCDPETGCIHSLNTSPCDDGDICTMGDKCLSGECKPTQWLNCNDQNPCTDDVCNPVAGCMHTANDDLCNDLNPCTVGDHCANGMCVGAGWMACDDGDPCTDDSCEPATGCVTNHNTADCDDKNACTTSDACLAGMCQGTGDLVCDDGNPCTDDSCDPATGCQVTPNQAPCDDGSACTQNDVCAGGTCQPGPSLVCFDGDDCTFDSCDPDSGCIYPPIAPCCGNGIVEGGEGCDDGNEIEDDGCGNDCSLDSQTVPGFQGVIGPEFDGWLQCEGYLDNPGGDDVPKNWGDDCTGNQYNKLKMVCGAGIGSYRYIDISKNVFKDGLNDYPETGLIYGANFSGYENQIYATGNHPHESTSWWGGGSGCGETATNTTVNNSCSWEASNCFGQNIGGSRYLWLYVAP